MLVADIYKVIDDETRTFIMFNKTDELRTKVFDDWSKLEQYWLDKRVIHMCIDPMDGTLLLLVE